MLVLTDFRVHDWTSGFRALTKKVYQRIGPEMSHKEFQGYTFQVAFLHKAVRAGFQVAEVPFHFTERTAGESKLGTEYIKNNLYYLFKARYLEIVDSRVFKMICVGALGAAVQFLCHSLLCWLGVPNLGAVVVSTELAIISNFICNNAWTFKDRQLAKGMLARKFVEFNVGSLPSLLIQAGISWGGEKLWGLVALLTIGGVTIGTGTIYLMVGILIGMVVNFFIYSHVVWRKK
jgi:dolichol-phosphate mannosyltransferase